MFVIDNFKIKKKNTHFKCHNPILLSILIFQEIQTQDKKKGYTLSWVDPKGMHGPTYFGLRQIHSARGTSDPVKNGRD